MKKIVILFISILLLCGCTSKNNINIEKYDMFYMDTYIEVKLYDVTKEESSNIFKNIDNIFSEYHKLSDRYNAYDDIKNIYYLNNELDEKEVTIDSKLSEMIKFGLDMYDFTDGYINIALGNVIDVWKEYRENENGVPGLFELSTSGSVDINDVSLVNNVYKKRNGVKLDLGAYAKGFVTEKVGEYLESIGYKKYLINAGGNVKVGSKYKSDSYLVGLEEPFNTSNIYKKILVENESIVTSGSYQRYYIYNDINYNHIINPKTLYPENYTKSVTIITKDSKYADILSTYMFLIPIEDGIKKIDELDGVEAIWYSDKIYTSKGFSNYE